MVIGRNVQFHAEVQFIDATVNVITLPPNMVETIVRMMAQLTSNPRDVTKMHAQVSKSPTTAIRMTLI